MNVWTHHLMRTLDALVRRQVARSRYYTPKEVAVHSSDDDCWVSFLGKVYDLTELVMVRTGIPIPTTHTRKGLSRCQSSLS